MSVNPICVKKKKIIHNVGTGNNTYQREIGKHTHIYIYIYIYIYIMNEMIEHKLKKCIYGNFFFLLCIAKKLVRKQWKYDEDKPFCAWIVCNGEIGEMVDGREDGKWWSWRRFRYDEMVRYYVFFICSV